MTRPIYLDYAATTPVDPRVANKMMQFLAAEGSYGNPASAHAFGVDARAAVDCARAQVADLIGADSAEIIWTSGATEANNLAIKGAAGLYQGKGRHVITLKTEHPSVLDSCQQLEKQGYGVTYLSPKADGLLDLELLRASLRDDTILVSIMHVNNEIGVTQDIVSIAEMTSARGILLHVDAVQSAGKLPIDLRTLPVDLMSFSAHKLYGPKGIGVLYIRKMPRVRVAAQIHGGGQEQGMRSGTLPTHQIVGMGEAFAIAKNEMQIDLVKIKVLRNRLLQGFMGVARVNGSASHFYPGILNLSFADIKAHTLIKALPELALSVGSACLSKGTEASYVLRALGQSEEQAHGGVRFSFGRYTTENEIDFAVDCIKRFLGKNSVM